MNGVMEQSPLAMPENLGGSFDVLATLERDLLVPDYDILAEAEAILIDESAVAELENQDFSLFAEGNEQALQDADLSNLDILGLLDHDANDADSVAQSQRALEAMNFVNLTAEKVTAASIMAEITRRESIFAAERATEALLRKRDEDDDTEEVA